MTKKIAILGSSECTNQAIMKALNQDHSNIQSFIKFLPFPGYHKDPDLPMGRISRVLNKLPNLLALNSRQSKDQNLLEPIFLFLARTLYGDIERHILSTYRPHYLINNDESFISSTFDFDDLLVYMHSAGGAEKLSDLLYSLERELQPAEQKALNSWLAVLGTRCHAIHPIKYLADIGKLVVKIARKDFGERYATLKSIYSSNLPDQIILLDAEKSETFLQDDRSLTSDNFAYKRRKHQLINIIKMFQKIDLNMELIHLNLDEFNSEHIFSSLLHGHNKPVSHQSLFVRASASSYLM
ncbi:MAG: hypothetical protein AB8G05_09835 [Oligoflexales bacterium]